MSRTARIFFAASLMVTVLPLPASASPQEYVVMGTPLVNLRTGPSTDAMVIARAEKGDVFRLVGQTEGWYEILMFSGETRYVTRSNFVHPLASDGIVMDHGMILPASTARARSVFWDTEAALDRAAREASEIIPRTLNLQRHTVLRKILEDRILLETFHIHGLQPAMYGDLVAAARKEGW